MVGADDPKAAGMGPVPVEPKAPVPKPPNYPLPAASEGIKKTRKRKWSDPKAIFLK